MTVQPILPKGEALWRTLSGLAERGSWTQDLFDQACQRFYLAATDEESSLQECGGLHEQDKPLATFC